MERISSLRSKYSRSIRVTALLTLLVFLITSVVYANPTRTVIPAKAGIQKSPIKAFGDDKVLAIPAELGSVQEFYKGTKDQTVILIQDAHAIPNAQRSVQELIDYFQKNYGVGLVALEGAQSKLDTQFFRSFPDKKLLKQVFQEYQSQGELSGGTAAAIFNESQSLYQGIEDWKLYEEGLGLYLQAVEKEPEIRAELEAGKKQIQAEKGKIYSKELLEIDHSLERFYENGSSLPEVLKKLSEVRAPAPGSELVLILDEMKKEGKQDNALEMEVRQMAKAMSEFLSSPKSFIGDPQFLDSPVKPGNDKTEWFKQKQSEFNQKFQEFNTSRLAPQTFALYLKDLAGEFGLSAKTSETLSHSVKTQKRIQELKGTKLFDDFERYGEDVKASLFKSAEEKLMDQNSKHLHLLERFASLELSHEDWEEVKKWKEEASASLRGASNQSRSNLRDRFVTSLLAMTDDMDSHVKFYEVAQKRDTIFFEHVGRLMKKENTKVGLVVAGGFHAEGLTAKLKETGISYLLIAPHIASIPQEINYRAHMQGNVSWKDYFQVENGRVSLYKAFVRAARDRLLSVDGRRSTVEESSVDARGKDREVSTNAGTVRAITGVAGRNGVSQEGVSKHERISERGNLRNNVSDKTGGRVDSGQYRPSTVDRLLLKRWRDQIIRDLADQGQIAKAHQYTRFLDELPVDGRRWTREGNSVNHQPSAFNLFARIEDFIQGLERLEARHQVTKENILKLLAGTKPQVSAAVPNSLDFGLQPATTADLPYGIADPTASVPAFLFGLSPRTGAVVLTPLAEPEPVSAELRPELRSSGSPNFYGQSSKRSGEGTPLRTGGSELRMERQELDASLKGVLNPHFGVELIRGVFVMPLSIYDALDETQSTMRIGIVAPPITVKHFDQIKAKLSRTDPDRARRMHRKEQSDQELSQALRNGLERRERGLPDEPVIEALNDPISLFHLATVLVGTGRSAFIIQESIEDKKKAAELMKGHAIRSAFGYASYRDIMMFEKKFMRHLMTAINNTNVHWNEFTAEQFDNAVATVANFIRTSQSPRAAEDADEFESLMERIKNIADQLYPQIMSAYQQKYDEIFSSRSELRSKLSEYLDHAGMTIGQLQQKMTYSGIPEYAEKYQGGIFDVLLEGDVGFQERLQEDEEARARLRRSHEKLAEALKHGENEFARLFRQNNPSAGPWDEQGIYEYEYEGHQYRVSRLNFVGDTRNSVFKDLGGETLERWLSTTQIINLETGASIAFGPFVSDYISNYGFYQRYSVVNFSDWKHITLDWNDRYIDFRADPAGLIDPESMVTPDSIARVFFPSSENPVLKARRGENAVISNAQDLRNLLNLESDDIQSLLPYLQLNIQDLASLKIYYEILKHHEAIASDIKARSSINLKPYSLDHSNERMLFLIIWNNFHDTVLPDEPTKRQMLDQLEAVHVNEEQLDASKNFRTVESFLNSMKLNSEIVDKLKPFSSSEADLQSHQKLIDRIKARAEMREINQAEGGRKEAEGDISPSTFTLPASPSDVPSELRADDETYRAIMEILPDEYALHYDAEKRLGNILTALVMTRFKGQISSLDYVGTPEEYHLNGNFYNLDHMWRRIRFAAASYGSGEKSFHYPNALIIVDITNPAALNVEWKQIGKLGWRMGWSVFEKEMNEVVDQFRQQGQPPDGDYFYYAGRIEYISNNPAAGVGAKIPAIILVRGIDRESSSELRAIAITRRNVVRKAEAAIRLSTRWAADVEKRISQQPKYQGWDARDLHFLVGEGATRAIRERSERIRSLLVQSKAVERDIAQTTREIQDRHRGEDARDVYFFEVVPQIRTRDDQAKELYRQLAELIVEVRNEHAAFSPELRTVLNAKELFGENSREYKLIYIALLLARGSAPDDVWQSFVTSSGPIEEADILERVNVRELLKQHLDQVVAFADTVGKGEAYREAEANVLQTFMNFPDSTIYQETVDDYRRAISEEQNPIRALWGSNDGMDALMDELLKHPNQSDHFAVLDEIDKNDPEMTVGQILRALSFFTQFRHGVVENQVDLEALIELSIGARVPGGRNSAGSLAGAIFWAAERKDDAGIKSKMRWLRVAGLLRLIERNYDSNEGIFLERIGNQSIKVDLIPNIPVVQVANVSSLNRPAPVARLAQAPFPAERRPTPAPAPVQQSIASSESAAPETLPQAIEQARNRLNDLIGKYNISLKTSGPVQNHPDNTGGSFYTYEEIAAGIGTKFTVPEGSTKIVSIGNAMSLLEQWRASSGGETAQIPVMEAVGSTGGSIQNIREIGINIVRGKIYSPDGNKFVFSKPISELRLPAGQAGKVATSEAVKIAKRTVVIFFNPEIDEPGEIAGNVAETLKVIPATEFGNMLRSEAITLLNQIEESGKAPRAVSVDKDLAGKAIAWFTDALVTGKIGRNMVVAFHTEVNQSLLDALKKTKGGIGFALFDKEMARGLDREVLKDLGFSVQFVGDLGTYRPSQARAVQNPEAVPVVNDDLTGDYLGQNGALFGVGVNRANIEGEPYLEVVEKVVQIISGLLVAERIKNPADLKNPAKLQEIKAELRKQLFKEQALPDIVSIRNGNLVINRSYLQNFITEYLARAELRKAA